MILEKAKCKNAIISHYKLLSLIFLSLIISTLIANIFTISKIIIKNKKIIKLNNEIKENSEKIKEQKKQLDAFQCFIIEFDKTKNDYYSNLMQEYREKYNLTKYQKRYDYFINPVENEEEAFTLGFNSEYGSGRTIYPQTHHGTDLKVIGKIINLADGIVYKVGENEMAGRYLVMYYNIQGREHLICFDHCNQILVKKGDKIKQGESIAKYGNTGNSSGPHNHFELNTKINGMWYSENFYMNSFHRPWSDEKFKTWRFVYE